ncbi:HAMP domain-containing histidine kinase [Staphylococcus massiliensis]|uniref:sensor histidine kinase n=1 Tax=Staphylococcus massiliensis TaxID=555791 RepID=UPI001EDE347D|nr:HAMP domain-containing sensor histidine kinase [Staphylococcus massiliensis]MCG3401419.1 HAMP domain-containing histidine kinase [Staphylococcus massiliensis]
MKLGTRIQIYTTVTTIFVIICTNIVVYFTYKHYALNDEIGQLENRAVNIMKEIKNDDAKDIQTEAIIQSHILSDGYISIVDKKDHSIMQISTDVKYKNLARPFQNRQYQKIVHTKDNHFALVSIPLIWKNGEVVNLQIFENVNFKYDSFSTLRWILLLSSLMLLVIIYVLNRIITSVITNPIHHLIDKMHEIERTNNYSHIDVNERDSKELKALSVSFNDMMDELKSHDERQQVFIMNASHELKTPITVIHSYSKMLKRFGKTKPDILEEGLTAIHDEGLKMKYLTEQLLDFTNYTHSEQALNFKRENLTKLTSEIVTTLDHVYDTEVKFEGPEEDVYTCIDKKSYQQLMRIFLDNAYKYSEDVIRVVMEETKTHIYVHIVDKGIGIPEADIPHIFTRFYRVDKARARQTGGTGLGLAIAKEIAKNNQIQLHVKSELTVGTTFTLEINKGVQHETLS